MIFFHFKFL